MSWRQIFLVLKREYITRARSKGFIISTILVPVGFAALFGFGILMAVWESDTKFEIGIVDETGVIFPALQQINEERYLDFTYLSTDSLRAKVQSRQITGYIVLSEETIVNGKNPEMIYTGAGGLQLLGSIRSDLREAVREEKLRRADVSAEIQEIFESRIGLDTRRLTTEGEETDDDAGFLAILGMVMGVVIFGSIVGYGGFLVRSVIEEKTNRIVEVITSSVRPIELLLGKMAGVGALAMTQIGIWLTAIIVMASLAGPVAGMLLESQSSAMTEMSGEMAEVQAELPAFLDIPTVETSIIVYFVIFFIIGYLLYSSLFAAIGAAADSETDTQQLMFPIMIPIFISYFIMFQAASNPDGAIVVAGSLIPFLSPIVMVTRIAITDVPFWHIGLSIFLSVIAFIGTMWLSTKIYKVGILNYGKSAGWKDLGKWLKH
jgi:ABC-2 type transport system permease protein